jgi:peptidoglycan L-alanyl-D-glutamate endopeptidase CwlK
MSSRKIEDLHPVVASKCRQLLQICKEQGIGLVVTSTYRSHAEQAELYAKGRTKPGPIVTNAKPGDSLHNYRVAFDVVPVRDGVAVWGTSGADGALWRRVGEIGEQVGLEWGGRWKGFVDRPHFQFTGGLTLADFKAGRTLQSDQSAPSNRRWV